MLSKKLTGLIAVSGLFIAGVASADVLNSAHDFQAEMTTTDLCAVCHTPHTSDTTVSDAPLWDHTLTTASYTLYSGLDLQGTIGQPGGISKLCLSCHDGTVGVDAYGGAAGTAANEIDGANFGGVGTGMLDLDLGSEHPISITYEDSAGGGTQDPDLNERTSFTNVQLFSGSVECASCHDVHDESTGTALLVTTNAGSALCLECHAK